MRSSYLAYLLLSVASIFSILGCACSQGNIYPLPKAYLKDDQLYARLKGIAHLDPVIAQLRVLGFSAVEELPIYALEIGKNQAKSNVLIIGQHHGDEVLGIELSVALAQEIMYKHSSDRKWQSILEKYRFYIVPTVNPEAWKRVRSGEYQFKRKNNQDTNRNGKLELRSDGVDLNRNYPVFWADQVPVPPNHPNFKGERPASEPEIQAIINLAERVPFDLAIFYHSSVSGIYSEMIYLPTKIPKDELVEARLAELMSFAKVYASQVKKDYQKGYYQVGEGNSSRVGNARNYFFYAHQCDAFLVEIGGINSSGISVVHPNAKMKDKINKKHIKALQQSLYQRSMKE